MFKITQKEKLSPEILSFEVEAKELAKKAKPGQFVIVRLHEKGERIPLSLAGIEKHEGTLKLIFMAVGKTTKEMATLQEKDALLDVVGPLGKPTPIKKYGTVVLVGGGFGAAPLFPIAYALKEARNEIITILGARSKTLLLLEKELRSLSRDFYITTDDGSKGRRGVVTDVLAELLSKKKIGLVLAIGPAIMMKFVSELTRPYKVKTLVSLNPIMVDGTGMCGSCRVSIGGETKFGCVDGPDFDGHEVDWDLLMAKQRMYLEEEQLALDRYLKGVGRKCKRK